MVILQIREMISKSSMHDIRKETLSHTVEVRFSGAPVNGFQLCRDLVALAMVAAQDQKAVSFRSEEFEIEIHPFAGFTLQDFLTEHVEFMAAVAYGGGSSNSSH